MAILGNPPGYPDPGPYQLPTYDTPPEGGGRIPPASLPPPPPPGGGGRAGSPFMSTLRSQTPLYGKRWPAQYSGWMPQGQPMQMQQQMPMSQSYGPHPMAQAMSSYPGTFQTPPQPAYQGPSNQAAATGSQGYGPTGIPKASDPYHKQNGDFSPIDFMQYLMARGYQGGAYDPEGSSAIHNALRQYLEAQGAGDIRKADLGAQMYGYDDPMGQQYVRQNAEQSVRDRIATALANGDLQSMLQNTGFLQNLFLNAQGATLRRDQKPQQSDIWGQLAGAGIGAAASGWMK